jgi:hypothetical protein
MSFTHYLGQKHLNQSQCCCLMEPQTTDQNDDLTQFRIKLWNRFRTRRETSTIDKTFDTYWYDFLIRHFMSNGDSLEETFQKY